MQAGLAGVVVIILSAMVYAAARMVHIYEAADESVSLIEQYNSLLLKVNAATTVEELQRLLTTTDALYTKYHTVDGWHKQLEWLRGWHLHRIRMLKNNQKKS